MKRKTANKRLRARLHEAKETLMRRRHEPIPKLVSWLRSMVQGSFNDHGVAGNTGSLESFRTPTLHGLNVLRRRSRRHRMTRERFRELVGRWIPMAQLLDLYPDERFYAQHRK